MIRICIIIDDQLHQMNVERGCGALFTPLSVWESVQVEQDYLILPQNWTVVEKKTRLIQLQKDANYSISNGKKEAFVMVRGIEQEKLVNTTVMIRERFSVGRSRRNELCYRDSFISTVHGVFYLSREGNLIYEDASTNGTFINGKRLQGGTCCLKTGDQLDFPPLCRVVVDSSVLHIRHTAVYSMINLPQLHEMEDEVLHVALFFQMSGSLRHVMLRHPVFTREEILKQVDGQLSDQDYACICASPALFERKNESLLHKMEEPFALSEHAVYVVI